MSKGKEEDNLDDGITGEELIKKTFLQGGNSDI